MTQKPYILVYLSFQINSKSKIFQFHSWIFSFARTSNQFLRKMMFFQFSVRLFFFQCVGPLAGNVVLCQCHSIAHVLALYFLVKADLSDLTRQDKKDPGQNGSRTRWIQDKREPGQNGSRTIWIQDNMDPGQYGTIGTIGIHRDNRGP